MDTSGIRCEGITKSFGGTRALMSVSLNIPIPGIIAIIGPNGAGKTTLLDVITGFVRADAGQCWVGHHEITHYSPYQIARLGIVRTFQKVRLIRRMSVLENVLLACPQQREDDFVDAFFGAGCRSEESRNRENALASLQCVHLDTKASEAAHELSFGQQKLLSLACCLASQSRFLFLDEPIAGLDPQMIRVSVGVLSRLRDAGRSLVLVEHDIATMQELADRALVMSQGTIIAQGAPDTVLSLREVMEAFLG
jgi:ABC-type branched-subunit amino acid transport system ATPase component